MILLIALTGVLILAVQTVISSKNHVFVEENNTTGFGQQPTNNTEKCTYVTGKLQYSKCTTGE
jgi:hypothetical protein